MRTKNIVSGEIRNVTMTKRNFETIARAIQTYYDSGDIVESFVQELEKTNPFFDAGRFRKACKREE